MSLKANYHTHSCFCDGTDTVGDIVEHALSLDFRHLGFSSHVDPEIRIDYPRYAGEVLTLKERYKDRLDILLGIELDTLYGDMSTTGGFEKAFTPEPQYLILSSHYLDLPPLDGHLCGVDGSAAIIRQTAETYFSGDFYRLAKAYFELEASILERLAKAYGREGLDKKPAFIGHFDLVTRFNDMPAEQGGQFLNEDDPAYLNPALEAMEYLVKRGLPFELNMGAVNRGRKKEAYPCTRLLRSLREFGGEIIINSDAHQKELLDGCFDLAIKKAIECGFTHTNILESASDGKAVWKSIPLDTL